MKLKEYKVIGLMSGTSLDGLDIAYAQFFINDKIKSCDPQFSPKESPLDALNTLPTFQILKATTVEYPKYLSQQLLQAPTYNGFELSLFDIEYGQWIGNEVKKFVQKNQINADFIASHGHTIFHQPLKQLSLQIGNGAAIAVHSGLPCINQFRNTDVCLGGQGAPLVPIGDHLLFSNYTACVNLGGFANISFVQNQQRIAFDICPCNLLINRYAQLLGFPYDHNGEIARHGKLNSLLLQKLNQLHYYMQAPPKSLGFEWVQENMEKTLNEFKIDTEDLICTLTEHAAIQISNCLKQFSTQLAWTNLQKNNVLFTGGGAYNTFLMERIAQLSSIEIKTANTLLIAYKEALIFGFLGVLRIREEENCLSSVTGARSNCCSGAIYLP